ncbi:transcription factor GTE4 [Carex littledalei]|uniref:Transcription factor GTE4 n=1 Tax=Carex littledalei TaxID=544730 RepID=A0A833RGW1_9POAL|nr:transcription factor GTE4 [Carex littledalei]
MKGSGDDSFCLSLFSSCNALLEKLMRHHHGWLFNEPVDVKKLRLKDYYSVIRHPMDLGTVKCRVHKGRYMDPLQFADDVRLTFRNAMTYNRKDDTAYAMAEELLGIFESEWPSIEAQLSDGKIEKEIDSVKKRGFSCKVEVIEEEWETKPCKIARKIKILSGDRNELCIRESGSSGAG